MTAPRPRTGISATTPPDGVDRWIPDPDSIPGHHETYRTQFGGVDYMLAYRRIPSRYRDRDTYGDWYLCVQGHRHPYTVDLRTVDDPDTTREQAMAFAVVCANLLGHLDHVEPTTTSR